MTSHSNYKFLMIHTFSVHNCTIIMQFKVKKEFNICQMLHELIISKTLIIIENYDDDYSFFFCFFKNLNSSKKTKKQY